MVSANFVQLITGADIMKIAEVLFQTITKY